jgi:hypothetical protein
MRKCRHLSIIMEMSAGSLTRFAHFFLRPRPECLVGRRKKVKNEANRQMRNMSFDEDLSQNLREPAPKTNPKSRRH